MRTNLPATGLRFLEELEVNNEREWFESHKDVYVSEVKEPALDFIEAVNERMTQFAPRYVRQPHRAALRIYRDVRFSHDKTPYNPRIAAMWPRQDLDKQSAASFFLQVGPDGVLIAAGSYAPSSPQLLAIRNRLLAAHAELRGILAAPALLALTGPTDGNELSRPPRNFPPEHPAADLLLRRRWIVAHELPSEAALFPDFLDLVAEHFAAYVPFVEWLNQPLATVQLRERR